MNFYCLRIQFAAREPARRLWYLPVNKEETNLLRNSSQKSIGIEPAVSKTVGHMNINDFYSPVVNCPIGSSWELTQFN